MAITGTNGNDKLVGTLLADAIFGLAGSDIIGGSPGADTIDGGADRDSVHYARFGVVICGISRPALGGAVRVALLGELQSGGCAEGDVLVNIENVGGSRENDTIRGNGFGNVLEGNGGDDILEGRNGADILRGDAITFGFDLGPDGNDRLDGGQ